MGKVVDEREGSRTIRLDKLLNVRDGGSSKIRWSEYLQGDYHRSMKLPCFCCLIRVWAKLRFGDRNFHY